MKTAAIGCAAMASPRITDAAKKGKGRPNVLFVICDDLNTHVSPSGYEHIETPTLSSFAKESMTFQRAFCQYPVCGPSRASLLHGLYPQSTGVLDNKVDISDTRPGTVSMPQHLKANGYWTASVGKIFHSKNHEPGNKAWDEFIRYENDELPVIKAAQKKFEAEHGSIEERDKRKKWKEIRNRSLNPIGPNAPGYGPTGLRDDQHKDGKNARQVISWLKEKSYGEKPFFIALGIQKPHVPFLAPDKYFDKYPKDKIEFHRDPSDLWNNIPAAAAVKRYQAFGFELGVENEPLRRSYMQAYHACVSFIDAQLGLVFKELRDQGLWENTIIVFTSDHGYHLGDHFLWGKVTLFDIGAKVPFIVRVPGMTTAGSRSDSMVELIDIFPTLTELTGLETPDHLQGTSLCPVLRDPNQPGAKAYAYSVVTRKDTLGYAIRNQKWRYGKWPDGEELYDLTKDPHERHNLLKNPEYRSQLSSMRKVLVEKQKLAQRRKL
jgi:iduronate 2-sulfatase